MLSVTVIPGIEGLLGSQKSCLLVNSFPSGPSTPPTGPAVPTDAPAWPLLQVVSCGPEALGVGRVGIHAQLTARLLQGPPPGPTLALQETQGKRPG